MRTTSAHSPVPKVGAAYKVFSARGLLCLLLIQGLLPFTAPHFDLRAQRKPAQQATAAPQLTLEAISRDAGKWAGTAPTQVRWTEDGAKLHFQWNPERADRSELYELDVRTPGAVPRKVADEEKRWLSSNPGNRNRVGTLKLYAYQGDLYFHDLRAAEVPFRITVGLTPVLLDQLADRDVTDRSIEYIDDQIRRAETDRVRFRAEGSAHRAELAEFYLGMYRALGEAYVSRFDRDIVGAFADLARTGHLEVLTSAATHGYLPLLDERTVHLQLATGRRTSRELLGIEPTGIWLPECAYRPGLEELLEAHGFTHFFTDANLLATAPTRRGRQRRSPRQREWSGAALAAIAEAERPPAPPPPGATDVFSPYLVADSDVVAVARHPEVSGQVWSAAFGYPGDPAYREFHRKDARSGLRYWRVTDLTADLGAKETVNGDARPNGCLAAVNAIKAAGVVATR